MKKTTVILSSIFLTLGTQAAHANFLTNLTRDTNSTKQTFAVYDVKPANLDPDQLQNALLSAIRLYNDRATVSSNIQAGATPAVPGKMELATISLPFGQSIQMPKCQGELFSIGSADQSMAGYGESTYSKVCVFRYQEGYRVDYYARFNQQSGMSSIGALGATLARAVGAGDSSKFIGKTMDEMEKEMKGVGATAQLIELFPKMEGRPVVQMDDPVSYQHKHTPIEARKDLIALGLHYDDQDQFINAIRKKDKVGVELFIDAEAVDLNQADKSGLTPLKYAIQAGPSHAEIAKLLRTAGAKE